MKDTSLLEQDTHFAFGKNWRDYASKVDEANISQAMEDLRRLSGRQRLDGMSFLDIGCGSGLPALAALRLGASRVVGVDIDSDSVAAANDMFARFAPGTPPDFRMCSVFDMRTAEFGTFDIVYSWGVLHHTGDMVKAVEAASAFVGPGGEFFLALYRKTAFCGMWRVIKRWYSKASPPSQERAMKVYISLRKLACRIRHRNFEAHVQEYGRQRGMDFYNDAHDWLGGYPYQSISPDKCRALLARLGFTIEREYLVRRGRYLPGLMSSGCDEYASLRTTPDRRRLQ